MVIRHLHTRLPGTCGTGLLLLLGTGLAWSQPSLPPPPAREVRAVWVTTAAGLDWPRSRNVAEQQSSLRTIVHTLHAAHFNTIYFQARARGDAYYRSAFEPWAENLTGSLGKDPGWDPLAFLLREAHARGMSVHAWFNVFKINGASRPPSTVPPHPARTFPGWTVVYRNEAWLDPGVPDVRSYTVRVAADLVRRYAVDGIHFDFIRYPGADFPDAESFQRYGGGASRDAWRRENVTRFVREVRDSIRNVRPDIQIGSAPLGVFSAANGGWGAYATYAQNSRAWLQAGVHDYLTPQIYWDTGATPGDPDFAALAAEWQAASYGRHVIAGMGAYKEEVRRELPQQIDITRRLGMAGQAFFRYEYVADPSVLGNRYPGPVLPPRLSWLDETPPGTPGMLAVTESAPGVFALEWSRAHPASDGDTARWYAVYRTGVGGRDLLVGITPGGVNFFVDTTRDAPDVQVAYAVRSVDDAFNEGPPAAGSASFREVADLGGRLSTRTGLAALLGDRVSTPALVAYRLTEPGPVVLEVETLDATGGPVVLADRPQDAGTYVVGLSPLRFPPGRYTLRLRTESGTLEQPLILR